jgi:hypothetical protein
MHPSSSPPGHGEGRCPAVPDGASAELWSYSRRMASIPDKLAEALARVG